MRFKVGDRVKHKYRQEIFILLEADGTAGGYWKARDTAKYEYVLWEGYLILDKTIFQIVKEKYLR